jgi:hypothetical protein
MRAKLVIVALLWLAWASFGVAELHRPSYTTLVLEFVGDQDKPVSPVVISVSSEEGEWYRQHLFREPRFLVCVDIVSASTLKQITELPLLERALEGAKPVDEEPKTPDNVRFTAGISHEHLQIMIDAQTSAVILKDIAKVASRYPALKSHLHEIENNLPR